MSSRAEATKTRRTRYQSLIRGSSPHFSRVSFSLLLSSSLSLRSHVLRLLTTNDPRSFFFFLTSRVPGRDEIAGDPRNKLPANCCLQRDVRRGEHHLYIREASRPGKPYNCGSAVTRQNTRRKVARRLLLGNLARENIAAVKDREEAAQGSSGRRGEGTIERVVDVTRVFPAERASLLPFLSSSRLQENRRIDQQVLYIFSLYLLFFSSSSEEKEREREREI